jgi:molybdate transport system substrate-binding protein
MWQRATTSMSMSPRGKWRGALEVAFLVFLAACAAPAPRTLTVFAAASLTDAFTQIGHDFESAHPGVTVTFNFAGSQTLRAQLDAGAQADVLAVAGDKDMDAARASGIVTGTASALATNPLIVIMPPDNPAHVASLSDLARPGLKVVLASADVPAGRAARTVLTNLETPLGAGFSARVLANVVSNEDNVRQVLAKIKLGEADAGLVYASDAFAAPEVRTLPIPAENNVRVSYPIAVLARAPAPDLATAFVAYVLSSTGQAALQKWGFSSP